MPTLYNQYIYRDGAWRQTGTSSDSVTYQLSLSEDTLTLTGSDGSTSSVSISGGGNSEIFIAHYDETTYTELVDAYEDGKALVVIYNNTIYSLNSYDAGYDSFVFYAPSTKLEVLNVYCGGTYGLDDTYWGNSHYSQSIGRITNTGDIATNTTIERGDRLVINDESASRLDNSSITFGTNSTQYLANNGTWQNIPTAPVTSVNSKTGAVNLTASDVGALPDTTEIPDSTSDLTNDSNFVSDANYVHTDNNFTDTLEAKLNGIAEGATVDDHKWNDVSLNKSSNAGVGYVTVYIPSMTSTSETSAKLLPATYSSTPTAGYLARYDASGYLQSPTATSGDSSTNVANTAFVQSAVNTAISGVNSFEYEVVQSLPTTNIKDHTIYLVAKTGSTGDVYDEYLYINNAWEHIGSTDVDLSGYVPTTRKVNNKALSSDITLTASDVGALPDSTVIPAQTAKIWTGTCSTLTGTNEKVVTLDDSTGFYLVQDVKIAVTFYNGEENLDSIKLNVNSTGAKSVYTYTLSNTSDSGVKWANNSTVFFTYVNNFWLFEGSALIQEQAYRTATQALPKSGGTMTGALTLSGDPTANLHAATKQYVDNAVSGIDLSTYMVKDTDYVTAGKKSGTTLGEKATAEGDNTTASGIDSHAEGSGTKATSAYAHAEGVDTTASNSGAHAEGMNTTASGMYAHAEGWTNTASAQGAHAEGMANTASNQAAHAEGCANTASGYYSHAEGYANTASGYYSHAEGYRTTAQRRSQHVFGELNVLDTGGSGTTVKGTYVEIVGNGTADNARSNARTLDWSGNETLAGKLTVGADPVNNMDVATKQYVDNSKEIFIATYGTTTYAEINTAYTAGKTVIVSRDFNGTTIYTLTDVDSSGTYHFRTFSSSGNIVYGCYIGTDGVWHVNSNTLASQSALETGLAEKQKLITVSIEEPTSTDGVDGDIWFVYEE